MAEHDPYVRYRPRPRRRGHGLAAIGGVLLAAAILAGIGVGISSSVIPYVADQVAMKRLTRAGYALMVSLLPATATVIGLIVLSQVPSVRDALGIALVIAGVALHREPTPPPAGPPPPQPRPSPALRPIPAASGSRGHP